MPLVRVRDVPEKTVRALRARAGARGLSLAAYLRLELERLAAAQGNQEVVAWLRERDRTGGPQPEDTVAELRKLRKRSDRQ